MSETAGLRPAAFRSSSLEGQANLISGTKKTCSHDDKAAFARSTLLSLSGLIHLPPPRLDNRNQRVEPIGQGRRAWLQDQR